MSEISEVTQHAFKDLIDKSIEGQKPGWKNKLLRMFVGQRKFRNISEKKVIKQEKSGNFTAKTTEEVEKEIKKTYLQILGEKPLVSLDEMFELPEETNESFGVIADLIANNRFSESTEAKLKSLKLDGHLIGIGTASIFAMLEAFEDCKSLTSVDIHPTPVAIGRMIVQLFSENIEFTNFISALGDEITVRKKLLAIGLPKKYIDNAMESVKEAVQQYRDVIDSKNSSREQDDLHVIIDFQLRNLFPLMAIRRNYVKLRGLAQEGKLNFIQDNFFWPGFWSDLEKNEQELSSENNLVYLSNGLDHVFRSKTTLWDRWQREGKTDYIADEQKAIGRIVSHIFKSWSKSKFVFTLTSLNYQLQLVDNPPEFAFDDYAGLILKDKIIV